MIELVLVMALLALAIQLSPFGIPLHELQRAHALQGLTGQRIVSLASPSSEIEVTRSTQTWFAPPARLREKVTAQTAQRPHARCYHRGRFMSGVPP